MNDPHFTVPIAQHIWDTKYRYYEHGVALDTCIEDTWQRVAKALAVPEKSPDDSQARFYSILRDFKFLPGGRIQAGAGTAHQVTLFNCFVMGTIADSMDGIFDALKEGALTMQQGGGVGYDFSTLRPRGMPAASVGSVASGPVSFMRIWDSMCATILSTGARRGAMMGTLRCDHPDIEEFIAAKQDRSQLRHFNVSVLITDAFMTAVSRDDDWPLVFPASESETGGELLVRVWPGYGDTVPCKVYKRIRARTLWQKIMQANYDYAEPGVLFIDRINRLNNLYYCETIQATNPCGEVPLPPYGACNLGSINLTQFVRNPFTAQTSLDLEGIGAVAATAVRLLDNVIDVSHFPLARQAEQVQRSRRIGLGITGLADALIMLQIRYGGNEAEKITQQVMQHICHAAYQASIELAREKGAFPLLDKEKYLAGAFVRTLPKSIRSGIAQYGIRNSHLTAIAPAGTISLLANNVSSGLEPVFGSDYMRQVLKRDGCYADYAVTDYAAALWRKERARDDLPPAFVTAHALTPDEHLHMQAAIQPYVDQAISKTINVPADYDFEAFSTLYQKAYDFGLKGCTTFRPNAVTGEILHKPDVEHAAPHCCGLEREPD
ncbi:adenosylcobalamin-dependent ribonucleoside-diphosphate reductase [Nitrosomonas sp. Is35]|uniref:adenosylcobalamin-dependent ribonucleoside-diphosphate reductase n=1 Tax=Nitrosomonas sp. Is35 TaxID=3080534 RepID=UPI00294B0116|nr:adenosylcobalamin-dependent ribonucleoside-diphosphate reductase [Nitrosomonas sp. Is35]MDV6348122.1 adenosylcobalamin-dependent ribonucleoside-diphosphate reductase [Nitrosomonas sp. Is35]